MFCVGMFIQLMYALQGLMYPYLTFDLFKVNWTNGLAHLVWDEHTNGEQTCACVMQWVVQWVVQWVTRLTHNRRCVRVPSKRSRRFLGQETLPSLHSSRCF